MVPIMTPYIRLVIAALIAGALAFTHLTAYRKGQHEVRAEWTAATAAADAESRRLEQARQRRADEAAQMAAARESRIRADAVGARRSADSLRDTIESVERASAQSLATANNAVRTLGDVVDRCTAEYQRVAEEADRATSEVRALRDAWPR